MAQAVTGFGFSLVSAPFLIAAVSAPRGVEWNLVLSAGLNLVLLARSFRHVRWPDAWRLLAPALVATVGVGLIARNADRGPLTVAAGVLCLAATFLVAAVRQRARPPGPAGAIVAGGISGAMNVVSGTGGPPVVLYGLAARWPPAEARATMQAYFFGINAAAIPTLGVTSVPIALPLALVAGAVVGVAVAHRISEPAVRALVLILAAVGSALAIAKGAGAF